MSYATPVVILFIVLFPVLVPLGVHAAHAIANWRHHYGLLRTFVDPKSRATTAVA